MSGRAKIYCLFFWSLFLILDFFVKQTMATDRFNSPIRPPLWRKNKVLLSRLLNRTSIIGPRHDPTDPVTINVHLQLQQIAEVDFNTQQVFSSYLLSEMFSIIFSISYISNVSKFLVFRWCSVRGSTNHGVTTVSSGLDCSMLPDSSVSNPLTFGCLMWDLSTQPRMNRTSSQPLFYLSGG